MFCYIIIAIWVAFYIVQCVVFAIFFFQLVGIIMSYLWFFVDCCM